MIAFKTKKDMMEFFKFVVKKLDKQLEDSGFEVNLSIMPIAKDNLQVVYETFKAYEATQKSVIQKA